VTLPAIKTARRRGALLLADISGYTSFLVGVAEAHHDLIVEADEPPPAYAVLSHLLSTVVDAIQPTFRLAKFEGDAVFAVGDADDIDGRAVLECLHRCHHAFRGALALAGSQWICTCNACARVGELDIKFILHHGSWVAQNIAGNEELIGADVNLAHRLLKNNARSVIGNLPYALLTAAAIDALGIPTDRMVPSQESYDGGAPFAVQVLSLAH
jgi:hypothetical protein